MKRRSYFCKTWKLVTDERSQINWCPSESLWFLCVTKVLLHSQVHLDYSLLLLLIVMKQLVSNSCSLSLLQLLCPSETNYEENKQKCISLNIPLMHVRYFISPSKPLTGSSQGQHLSRMSSQEGCWASIPSCLQNTEATGTSVLLGSQSKCTQTVLNLERDQ